MKKTLLAIASIAMMFAVVSCGTTEEAAAAAPTTGPSEVVSSNIGGGAPAPEQTEVTAVLWDYQGKNLGAPIPEWVLKVAQGNYSASAFIDIMPEMADKELFVSQARGPNLSFIKEWTNLVDIEREVASILQRGVGKALQAAQEASQHEGDTADAGGNAIEIDLEKAQKTYQTSMTNVVLVGLKKTTEFWARYKVEDINGKVVDSYYDYFVVYTMDKDQYDAQIDAALNQVPAATDQDSTLKSIIGEALKQQMLGGDPTPVKQ